MGIIAFDESYNQGYGKFYVPSITGTSFTFPLPENIAADISEVSAITSLGDLIVNGWVTPVVKIISDYSELGFVGNPDTRWKFGSLGYCSGVTIERPAPDIEIINPIPLIPEYVIYPVQTMQVNRFSVYYPDVSWEEYEVVFDFFSGATENNWVLNSRLNSSNSPSFNFATHVVLNPALNVVWDVNLYYSFQLTTLDYFADTRDRQNILI